MSQHAPHGIYVYQPHPVSRKDGLLWQVGGLPDGLSREQADALADAANAIIYEEGPLATPADMGHSPIMPARKDGTTPFDDLNAAQTGVPLEIRRELLRCATAKAVNYHWLCWIYKRGSEAAEAERDEARALLQQQTQAIQAFLDKWAIVEPRINGLFGLNFARTGKQYDGPTLTVELDALAAALSATPPPASPEGEEKTP